MEQKEARFLNYLDYDSSLGDIRKKEKKEWWFFNLKEAFFKINYINK